MSAFKNLNLPEVHSSVSNQIFTFVAIDIDPLSIGGGMKAQVMEPLAEKLSYEGSQGEGVNLATVLCLMVGVFIATIFVNLTV